MTSSEVEIEEDFGVSGLLGLNPPLNNQNSSSSSSQNYTYIDVDEDFSKKRKGILIFGYIEAPDAQRAVHVRMA